MMFSYTANHLRKSGSNVRKNLSHIAEIEIEVTKLGAFPLTIHYGVISRLSPDDMTHFCGDGGVIVQVAQGIFQKWSEMCIFRVLRSSDCNPILVILAIVCSAEVDWEATAVEWFPLDYEQSKLIFIPAFLG